MRRLQKTLLFSLLTFSMSVGIVSAPSRAAAEPQTVSFVDVSKYLGVWYQIAHIPLFFEGGPCACARQKLSLGDGGVVKVYNSCNDVDPSGKLREISGEAYNEDPKSNAKFSVDFHVGVRGSYWIIGLDPQYRYAVVSDKSSYSFYILAKTPTLPEDLIKKAIAMGTAQGLDASKLDRTVQAGCSYPKDEE